MLYPLSKLTFYHLVKTYIRKVEGLENVPKDGRFIAAINHSSYLDDLIIPTVMLKHFRKKIHFYVNHLYFRNPVLRNFLLGAGSIPVAVKKSPDAKIINEKAFKEALRHLAHNEPVGIFPEGHRSPDGKLQRGKTGVARLALAAKVPVIPMGITGSYQILPKGKSFPRFRRCTIRIGAPMHFDRYLEKGKDRKALEKITKCIMKEIAKLTRQTYPY